MSKNLYKKPLYEIDNITDLKDMLNYINEKYSWETAFLVKENGKYSPVSYRTFCSDVKAFGTALLDLGLLGKRVAVIGENRYEWAVAYMAIVCGVGVVVPLDRELPKEELDPLIEVAGLEGIIYSQKNFETLENTNIKHKICMDNMPQIIEHGRKLLSEGDKRFAEYKLNPEELSILLFTSGTTSVSKAVMLSQKNIVTNIMDVCKMMYVDHRDTCLSMLPLHHTYECTCGFLTPLFRGCTIAYCEGLRHVAKNLREAKATFMLCVPLLASNIHKKIWQQAEKSGKDKAMKKMIKTGSALLSFGVDVRKILFAKIRENLGGYLRMIVCGAAAADPGVVRDMRAFGFDFIQGYGLTECSPILTVNRIMHCRDASAGLPMPSVHIKIYKPDKNGIGEIIARGDNLMLGYYKNELATEEVMDNGFFHTGDLGYLDHEGFLYITGRKKNVIVTKNGKNIFPEELETYLNRSRYVSECLAYGIDDGDGDTKVAMQVVPDMVEIESEFGKDYGDESIKKLINEEVLKVNHVLQNYKRIGRVIVRYEEFEKTTTRKIKRHLEINKMK